MSTLDHSLPTRLGFSVSLRGTAALVDGIITGSPAKGKEKILEAA
jgi:hypothetical protein